MKNLTIDWTELSMDPKWYDFETGEMVKTPKKEGVFLNIKPYPAEKSNLIVKEKGLVITGGQQKEVFMHCLVDWQGVVDAKGGEIECTEAVKEKVYDFKLGGIPDFVVIKSREFADKKDASEKN